MCQWHDCCGRRKYLTADSATWPIEEDFSFNTHSTTTFIQINKRSHMFECIYCTCAREPRLIHGQSIYLFIFYHSARHHHHQHQSLSYINSTHTLRIYMYVKCTYAMRKQQKQKREKYNFLMHRSWACNGENRRRHSRQPLQITNVLIGQFSLFNSFDSMSLQLNASYIHKYMRWIMDIERWAMSYNVVYYCSWLLCRLMIADYVRFDSETVKWKTKFQIKVKKKKSNLRETFNVVPIDHFLFQFQLFFTIISINVCSFDDRFINLNCFILRKIPKILIFVTKNKKQKTNIFFQFFPSRKILKENSN